jgi:hypothetical protein
MLQPAEVSPGHTLGKTCHRGLGCGRLATLAPRETAMESDWKKFRAMLPVWRDRYLAERNTRIASLLAAPGKTDTERFWDAEEAIRNEAKTLRLCLDHISRSNMRLTLFQMRNAGMLKKEDLADFSTELQRQIHFDSPEVKDSAQGEAGC